MRASWIISAGGSGGARDSIIFTLMWPELVRKLAVWTIVGGTYSTMSLANVYVMNELRAVRSRGIEGVMEMSGSAGGWADMIAANPRNHIHWPHQTAQKICRPDQQIVAHRTAMARVDPAQPVQINQQHRAGYAVLLKPIDVAVHLAQKVAAVRQCCETIDGGLAGTLLQNKPHQARDGRGEIRIAFVPR